MVAVMISRVRPSLNGAREALKTWDEARVIWPRIKVFLFLPLIFLHRDYSFRTLNVLQSVLSMEESKPFSEKPIDRSIALSIYNGSFVWRESALTTTRAKRNRNL